MSKFMDEVTEKVQSIDPIQVIIAASLIVVTIAVVNYVEEKANENFERLNPELADLNQQIRSLK